MKPLIPLFLLLSACSAASGSPDPAPSTDPLHLECDSAISSIHGSIRRCENVEVICYTGVGSLVALQCKWKV